jgi:predicted nucleic acid-binding protein
MKPVFGDSFYYFALANPSDTAHAKAVQYAQSPTCPKFVTEWVITELADGLSAVQNRPLFVQFSASIR